MCFRSRLPLIGHHRQAIDMHATRDSVLITHSTIGDWLYDASKQRDDVMRIRLHTRQARRYQTLHSRKKHTTQLKTHLTKRNTPIKQGITTCNQFIIIGQVFAFRLKHPRSKLKQAVKPDVCTVVNTKKKKQQNLKQRVKGVS